MVVRRRVRAVLVVALAGALVLAQAVGVVPVPAARADVTVSSWADLKAAFATGDSQTVTLGADITSVSGEQLAVPSGATITLDLNGRALTITVPASTLAGIAVPVGAGLIIADSGSGGTLSASGGYRAAGIGGGAGSAAGSVSIAGGAVAATGGHSGAGIGGGDEGAGGAVIISGGEVTATGGPYAAGIGGGNLRAGGTVAITGGSVTATGGMFGTGIGGGYRGNGGAVSISGGSVTASGGNEAAGIGGGMWAAGGAVSILGGSVTATGGYRGAGIGSGGYESSAGTLTVGAAAFPGTGTGGGSSSEEDAGVGATITADSSSSRSFTAQVTETAAGAVAITFGAAVTFDAAGGAPVPGAQFVADGGTATEPPAPTRDGLAFGGWHVGSAAGVAWDFASPVSGNVVLVAAWLTPWDALQAAFAAGGTQTIALGQDIASDPGEQLAMPSGASITLDLNGHTLTITAPADGLAGIDVPVGATLAIADSATDGALSVVGGVQAAGIGGNNTGAAGTVTIAGGSVTARGGVWGAGVGGGANGIGGPVNVTGGSVIAQGGGWGAGIGGGFQGAGGPVAISGGSVTATGGILGSGIGGGREAPGGTVTISGGSVAATGGTNAAGIGGGILASGGDVTMSGGSVTATGGAQGAGIGSGTAGAAPGTLTVQAVPMVGAGTSGGSAVGPTPGAGAPISSDSSSSKSFTAVTTNAAAGAVAIQVGGLVTFDAAGGTPVPGAQFVANGGTATEPAAPSRSGFDFRGWRVGSATGAAWDFSTPVTENVTLVAAWMSPWDDLQAAFASGGTQTVTLGQDITSDPGEQLAVPVDADITLDLNGHVLTIAAPVDNLAGIDVPVGAALTVTDSATGGRIDVTGGHSGAGIGGGEFVSAGTVTILGGAVTAAGGFGSAGIGGGYGGDGGPVTVSGGTVEATGGVRGAGIGGGHAGDGGAVTVSGGSVTATGGLWAAGIGAAFRGTAAGTLTIDAAAFPGTGTNGGSSTSVLGGPGAPIAPNAASSQSFTAEATDGVHGAVTIAFGVAVTFDAAGGTPAPSAQFVEAGAAATEPAAPTREGFDFRGWHEGSATGAAWDFASPVTENSTLVAAWASPWDDLQAAFAAGGVQTVTLTQHITSDPGEQLALAVGADITLDLNGHTLTITPAAADLAGIDLPVGASLTVVDSGVSGTLDVAGGDGAAGIGGGLNATGSGLLTVGAVAFPGAGTTGGSSTATGGGEGAQITAHPGATASFTATVTDGTAGAVTIEFGLAVTFDTAGGSPAPDPQFVSPGETATVPTAPTSATAAFAGWQADGVAWDFATPVSENLELTATWITTSLTLPEGPFVPGDTVPVSGEGFDPHEQVSLVLHSDPVTLATVTADATGAFSVEVTIPSVDPGDHTLVATGLSSGLTASAAVEVDELPEDGSDDLLSGTGADLGGPLAWALLLLAMGAGAITLAVRARRLGDN